MQTRRSTIQQAAALSVLLAASGVTQFAQAAFSKTAFDAKSINDALKAIDAGGAMTESVDVILTAPDIAENGAVVPLGISTTMAGVKQLLLFVEKNPVPLVAMFYVNDSIDANFLTRAKMGQSSDVYAVAIMQDGKSLYSKKTVKVTLGGCGG